MRQGGDERKTERFPMREIYISFNDVVVVFGLIWLIYCSCCDAKVLKFSCRALTKQMFSGFNYLNTESF